MSTPLGALAHPWLNVSAVCLSASQSAGAGIVANFGGSSLTIQTLNSGDNIVYGMVLE